MSLSILVALASGATAGLAQTAAPAPAAAPTAATAPAPTPAVAPAEDAVELEEYVITGIRGSLTAALDVKRQNMQSVDSVVAEDIGKFPDNNAVEALQRVSGVQVTNRFRGEVASVTIRGMPDIATTENGRNIFTASGRAVALADIPAALLSRIDVYKTRSSDLIEAGIAGVIDVRTHRPFDFKDRKIVLAARGIYQEQADTVGPNASALISNTWDLDGGGRFGALFGISYAKTDYRDQSMTAGAMVPFVTGTPPAPWTPYERIFLDHGGVAENPIWTPGLPSGLPSAPGSTLTMNGVQVPYILSRDAVFASDFTGERKRPAANLALQFAPNEKSTYTFEAFYNGFRETTFNDLHFAFVDWWGALSATPSADIDLYPNTNIVKARRNVGFPFGFMSGDYSESQTDSYVYALNGQWEIGDKLTLESDVSFQDSEFETEFFAVRTTRVHRMLSVDFNQGGGLTGLSYADDPTTSGTDESDLTDPTLWDVGEMWDNGDYAEGSAKTLSIDGDYKADWGFLKSLGFGMRYDNRGASEGNRRQNAGWLGLPMEELPEGAIYNNENFFDGRSDVPRSWAVFNGHYIPSHADEIRTIYNTRINAGLDLADDLVMAETFDVTEKTLALYAMANFEFKVHENHTLDGQVGFRYVKVDNDLSFGTSTGSSSRNKTLPSVTLRYGITENLRLRFSYCETLRPPGFNDLNPTITYVEDVTDIGYGTASGGNADLQATESKNADVSLEWYFGKSNAIYGSVFRRDIDGLVVPYRRIVEYENYPYVLSQPYNASNGDLTGYELGAIYFLDNVPDLLQGLGMQASYTSLDSEQNIPITDSAGNITGEQTGPFFAVSDSSYSLMLAYEKKHWGARLGYVWRENFLNNNEAALFANPLGIYRRPEKSLDLQISWQVMDNLTLTLDATNLTNEMVQSYYGDGGNTQNTDNFGSTIISRTFALGARYSF